MGRIESRAEELGKRARQVAIQLYDWDKIIRPLDELFQEGENFHSIRQIPSEFERANIEIAGKNAQLLFKLFANITSKPSKITSEEGGGIYKPYVYDKRDPTSTKVLGVKIERRGGLSRLATLELALPADKTVITLSVQNTRLPDSTPDLVFRANKEGITLVKKEQQVPEDEKWLDKPFRKYLEKVLTEAQALYPELTS